MNFLISSRLEPREESLSIIEYFIGVKQEDYFVLDEMFVSSPTHWSLPTFLSRRVSVLQNKVRWLFRHIRKSHISSQRHIIETLRYENCSFEWSVELSVYCLSEISHIEVYGFNTMSNKEIDI